MLSVGLVPATHGRARDAEHDLTPSREDPHFQRSHEMEGTDMVVQQHETLDLQVAGHAGLSNKGGLETSKGVRALAATLLDGALLTARSKEDGSAASAFTATVFDASMKFGREDRTPTWAASVRDPDDGFDALSGLAGLFLNGGFGSTLDDVGADKALYVDQPGEPAIGHNGPAMPVRGLMVPDNNHGEQVMGRAASFDLNIEFCCTEETQVQERHTHSQLVDARVPLSEVGARINADGRDLGGAKSQGKAFARLAVPLLKSLLCNPATRLRQPAPRNVADGNRCLKPKFTAGHLSVDDRVVAVLMNVGGVLGDKEKPSEEAHQQLGEKFVSALDQDIVHDFRTTFGMQEEEGHGAVGSFAVLADA